MNNDQCENAVVLLHPVDYVMEIYWILELKTALFKILKISDSLQQKSSSDLSLSFLLKPEQQFQLLVCSLICFCKCNNDSVSRRVLSAESMIEGSVWFVQQSYFDSLVKNFLDKLLARENQCK